MNSVVVIIPHFNNPEGLYRCLSSIDASESVDVLIVDDGSRQLLFDEEKAIALCKAKGKLTCLYLRHNQGIEEALNTGLDFAIEHNYNYIARLDSDDQCIGARFKIQEDYLNHHPDIVLVGTNAYAVDEQGNYLYDIVYPEDSESIKKKMYINSMFLHPGVMFRADIVLNIGKYPTDYKAAEDYAYFFAVTRKYKTANIQQFLMKYEINPQGISHLRRREQVKNRIRVIVDNFYFGIYPIYGLVRNAVIYLLPHRLIQLIKRSK